MTEQGAFSVNTLTQIYHDSEIAKSFYRTGYILMILSALCGVLLMTSCGRSNTNGESEQPSTATAASKPSATPINACALVTKADAERILGESVKDTDGDGSGCAYEITDFGVGGRTAVLMVGIETDGKMAFEMHKKMSGITDGLMDVARDDAALDESQRAAEKQTDRKIQQLSGIGDKGYMSGGFRGGFMGSATVSVVKGDTWILIQIIGSPKKGSEEALKAVAKKVADAV